MPDDARAAVVARRRVARMSESSHAGDERLAAVALDAVPGLGPVRQRALRLEHGSARAALATLPAAVVAAADHEAHRRLDAAERAGARLLLDADADYPASLRDLHDPPPVLWALGDLAPARGGVDRAAPSSDVPLRVAIVGTRHPSPYGARVADELARTLAQAGAIVVSGMAEGIDAAAHVAALDVGAPSIAVLGTGVDVAYPARHRPLHRRLVEKGLVLSEFPPGAAATAGAFPRRNRLLAALCPLTIVVEAGLRSGALITAGHALDLGRAVAAVPGHIDAPEAAGANALLRDGAHVLTDVGALLELIGVDGGAGDPLARMAHRAATAPVLDGDERVVWEALAVDVPDADALTARAALPVSRCLAALGILELSGHVICDATGTIRRSR